MSDSPHDSAPDTPAAPIWSTDQPICYHRHTHYGTDWGGATIAGYPLGMKLVCADCGASVVHQIGSVIPPLVPMPHPVESPDSQEAVQ